MKLMCLWCLSEGRMAYLGVRGSTTKSDEDHAICQGHLVQPLRTGMTTKAMESSYQEFPPLSSRSL